MFSRIETLNEKKLASKSIRTNLIDNKTFQLWGSFMPLKKSISDIVSPELYSIQIYDDSLYFKNFTPHTEFTKVAGIEVSNFDNLAEGIQGFTLNGGLYAIFIHKGPSSEFPKTMQYILGQWLPNSEYQLDHRPHFEIVDTKHKHTDPDAEEEIWIPIRLES